MTKRAAPAAPAFALWLQQFDGHINIAPFVESVSYTDHAHGEADEIEITLDDFDAELFKGEWMPAKGQQMRLELGYAGGPMLPCGIFTVDEISYSGPPDRVEIRAQAASTAKALRQDDTRAFDGQTLEQIARDIASRHGLKVIGEAVDAMKAVPVPRVTQHRERDLAFLKRLAETYGFAFKVVDKSLVFTALEKLESARPALILPRQVLNSFRLIDSAQPQYSDCEVRYHDPRQKRLVVMRADGSSGSSSSSSGRSSQRSKPVPGVVFQGDGTARVDKLKVKVRCDSDALAAAQARARLSRANGRTVTGNLVIPGHPGAVAGITIELQGMLGLSGVYFVEKSRHAIARGRGYTTDLEVRQVAQVRLGSGGGAR